MRQVERDILDWAADEQRGLVARWQAVARGMSTSAIDRRLAGGAWVEVHPTVYRGAGTPLDWEACVLAAVLATEDPPGAARGRRSAACGSSAAALLGIERAARVDTVEIIVSGAFSLALTGVTVHRTAELPPGDIQKVRGIPATTGARTVVDLAPRSDRVEALAVADEAVAARCTSVGLLHRRTSELAPGRRNVSYLAVMTSPEGREEFRSWLERFGRGTFRAGGLPNARWNVPILDGAGRRVAVADALFEGWRLIVELDGPRFHDPPGRRDHDRRRDRKLTALGFVVLRFGYWELVREAEAVVAELRAVLDRRAPLGSGV